MSPKSWRKSINITIKDLSKMMDGISLSYLSDIENFKKEASGRFMRFYYKLSKRQVTPDDFPEIKK